MNFCASPLYSVCFLETSAKPPLNLRCTPRSVVVLECDLASERSSPSPSARPSVRLLGTRTGQSACVRRRLSRRASLPHPRARAGRAGRRRTRRRARAPVTRALHGPGTGPSPVGGERAVGAPTDASPSTDGTGWACVPRRTSRDGASTAKAVVGGGWAWGPNLLFMYRTQSPVIQK